MKVKLSRKVLVAIAGLIILCGVLFAFVFTQKPSRKLGIPEELAFWVDLKGEVQVRKPNTDDFVDAKVDDGILSTETARTGPGARAVVEILGGVQFEIYEETRVLFEKQKNEKTRISVLDGHIRWKGSGDLAFVEVARQGQVVPLDEVKNSEIAANVQVISTGSIGNLVVPTEGDTSETGADEEGSLSADAGSRTTISQDEILNVLSIRLGQFKKCYLNLIQRSSNVKIKANILMSFMILSNGNVEDARVWKSNVDDRLFLGCISEVVQRTRFKPFKGDPIRIDEFPLDFD